MSESVVPRSDDVLGAIGTPVGIVAAVLAIVPVLPIVNMFFCWMPGLLALGLGLAGLWRSRGGRGPRGLSVAAVALGSAAILATAALVAVWGMLGLMMECMDVAECG